MIRNFPMRASRLASVALQTVRHNGSGALLTVLRGRANQIAALPVPGRSLFGANPFRLRSFWGPSESSIALAIRLVSYLGGFTVGAQLPETDIKISRHGDDAVGITFHGVAQISMEVALQWLEMLVEKMKDSRELDQGERALLIGVIASLRHFSAGVTKGTQTRRRALKAIRPKWKRRMLTVPVEKPAYQLAESILRSIVFPAV